MGLRDEFSYLAQSINSFDETVLFSSLGTPDEGGTLPTFTVTPLIEITAITGRRLIYVKSKSTTQVVFDASGSGDPFPITIDFRIVSRETTTPTAGGAGTVVTWPYYCSKEDVRDEIINIDFGANAKLTPKKLMMFISKIFGEINAAGSEGGYDVPFTNGGNATTITAGISLSDDVVTVGVADDSVLVVGDTAFIHGQTGNTFNAEFTPIVNVDTSADTVVVINLQNDYNSGATIEKCQQDFLSVRDINVKGAAVRALNSLTVRSENIQEKLEEMQDWYEQSLQQLRDGKISKGVDRDTVITSLQVDDSDENVICFELSKDIS